MNGVTWADVRFDFSGRRVLVTGGPGGIGRGIAEGFRAAGASVVVTGTRAREAYGDAFEGLEYRQLDVSDTAAVAALSESMPSLDVLVNNAGMAGRRAEHSPEGFARTVDVNLTGVMRCCHAFHDQLRASAGSVVNIASMTSYFGSAHVPAYSASKGGVVQLTASLAIAWAVEGIRVNAIAPGWIETNLTRPLIDDPSRNEAILTRTPLARWGLPADCAGAVLFLCSEAARFITGETVAVDGGYHIT